MHAGIPLSALGAGELGRVREVVGMSDHVHRLEELGLRSGAEVEMVQRGSPCIIRLAGQKFCFRGDDLMSVLVTPERVR